MALAATDRNTILKWAFAAVCLIGTATMFAVYFNHLSNNLTTGGGARLGIDNLFYALDDWNLLYSGRNGLKNPPWSVLVLMPPAELLTHGAAWGLLVFFTITGLVACVPPVRPPLLFGAVVLLLVTSFPSLRNIADANLEGLVVVGTLLVIAGYRRQNPLLLAGGSLLATAKPQVVVLMMAVLGFYMLATWPPRKVAQAAALVAAVVIPSMLWRGAEWLNALDNQYQAGSIIDISIRAALDRTGAVPELFGWVAWVALLGGTVYLSWRADRTFSREKAALLIATSLLLAPYAAGNSVINVLAIGGVALLFKKPWAGILLFVMADAFYPFNSGEYARVYAYYWTVFLVVSWALLAWHVWQTEIAEAGEVVGKPMDAVQPTTS